MTPSERAGETRITSAIKRLSQKIDYLKMKNEADPTCKAAYWAMQDIDAYELAIECLEYTQMMREYEASQVSL